MALELFLELHAHRLRATDAACVAEMLALAAGDRSDDDFIAGCAATLGALHRSCGADPAAQEFEAHRAEGPE